MKVPYELLRAARAALDVTHEELVAETGVSKRTLVRIEKPETVSQRSLDSIRKAFEARGVEFLPAEGGKGPGLRIPPEMAVEPKGRHGVKAS